ncbi:MAG: 4-amino-4-deoxy-L-arabinose transferase-like glycosyltransferase [Rhodothermales bacterium]|jgi:4-amino-4-deoxy-L-arabinose transferase-like glycosyltransferase
MSVLRLFLKGSRGLILVSSLALVCLLRMHSFDEPLEADESVYMLIAQDWAEGGRPYVDYWDNKPIGTFVLYRAGIAVFGYQEMAPRLMALLATILTTLLLACWLWRMGRGVMAACLVVIWPVLSIFPACQANGANMEIFLLPIIVGACCCLRRYRETQDAKWWWLGTALLALSPLLKQVMAPFLLLPLLVLPPCDLRKNIPRLIGMAAIGLFGHLLVYGICGYSPAEFFGMLRDAASYTSGRTQSLPVRVAGTMLTLPALAVLRILVPLVLAAYIGPILAYRRGRGLLELGVLLASLVAVGIPGGGHNHYYILLLPAMVIGSATLLERMPRRLIWATGAALGVYLGVVVQSTFLSKHSQEISRDKYGWAWFPRDRFIGQQLRQLGITGGRLFTDGSHPGVAFYSGNAPAPRVFVAWAHPLTGLTPADILVDLQAAPPEYCVWMNPQEFAPGFAAWIEANYQELAPIAGARIFIARSGLAQ